MQTIKDLTSGAVGGIAQVLLGLYFVLLNSSDHVTDRVYRTTLRYVRESLAIIAPAKSSLPRYCQSSIANDDALF